MNVYDFDQTIYRHDSTADFIVFLMKRNPKTWLNLPRMIGGCLLMAVRIWNTQQFKGQLYHMFRYVDDMEGECDAFVDSHMQFIKPFYKELQKEDDVIISASPYFNISRFCKKLGIRHIMASEVDIHTGKMLGPNCHDKEKVRRFRQEFPDEKIDNFYSDSLHDTPLARMAEHAWLVKKDEIMPWPSEKENH